MWRGNTLVRLCTVTEGTFVFDHMDDHFINAGGNISPNLRSFNRDIRSKPTTPLSNPTLADGVEFTVPADFPYKQINEGIREVTSCKGRLEKLSEHFLAVAASGSLTALKQIVETGLVNVNVSDKTGFFALLAASVNCHVKVINFLLDNGANMNQLTDEGGYGIVAVLMTP